MTCGFMIPASLGHYRIVRAIGAGGMGDVYLAEDTKLGRQVALKVLTSDGSDRNEGDGSGSSSRAERRQRFEREARAVAALNHPNIITIYSVEEHEAVLFLTMEYVEGRTLTDLIPREGMSLAQWLQIAIPLADAVGAAHQRGITHRDLKAANVMVGSDGRLKVLDFGLAKVRDESRIDGLSRTLTVEPLTGEGRIIGTVAYMSPEQAQGKPVDARSDVFSLGILLFEMATGQRPFQGDTSMSVLSAIIKDTPAPVTDLRADLPRDVGRVLRRCLAKDPEERYQTAKDLRADLRLLKEDVDSDASGRTQPVTATLQRPRSWRAPLWLALGAVAVIAAGAAWWYVGRAAAHAAGVCLHRHETSDQYGFGDCRRHFTRRPIRRSRRWQRRQAGAVAAAGDDTEQHADRPTDEGRFLGSWHSHLMARACCTSSLADRRLRPVVVPGAAAWRRSFPASSWRTSRPRRPFPRMARPWPSAGRWRTAGASSCAPTRTAPVNASSRNATKTIRIAARASRGLRTEG